MQENTAYTWTPKMIMGWIAVFLIFFGIFAKDIVSFYFLDYSLRNHYGAAFVFGGGAIASCLVLSRYKLDVLQLFSNKLIVSWTVMLLFVAPLTAYIFNDRIFISPQAVGFCAALTCYLVSRHITKSILFALLVAQFLALLYEYHYGVSLTITVNEAKNIYFSEREWLIDGDSGLVRTKGLLDSTHDSTWLFFYSALIFELGAVILVFTFCAGWMAQGRLAIVMVGILCLVSKDRVRILVTLAVVGLLATAIYPSKVIGGVKFFLSAFDAGTTSNRYRVEATGAALEHILGGSQTSDDAKDIEAKIYESDTEDAKADDAEVADAGVDGARLEDAQLDQANDDEATVDDTEVEDVTESKLTQKLVFVLRMIFGASSSALGPGTVPTEMGYTLFAIEYGIIGLALMGWTTLVVLFKGWATKNRSCITLGAFIPVLMLSSGTQSASTFFMLWLAVLFLTRVGDIKPGSA